MTTSKRLLNVGLFWVMLLVGCSDSTGRLPINGRVVRAGQPVDGSISFVPGEGHPGGPAANAPLENGWYEFTSENGPTPGNSRITIDEVRDPRKATATSEPVDARPWVFDRNVGAEDFDPNFDLVPLPPPSLPTKE